MNLREAVYSKQDAMLKSLQESIRIPSVEGEAVPGCPYGEEVQKCLEHALKTAENLGFSVCDMDHQMGWCEYGEGDEMVAVLGHLDVVPQGDGWTVEPFGGEIRDGKIFGRGTMDDKGPVMAALYALAAIRDTGLPLKRRIRIFFGTNEETGSNDMKYYKEHGGEIPVMGFTPDGEYPVINGEKGLITVTFEKSYSQEGDVRIESIHGGTAPNVVPAIAQAKVICSKELAEELAEKSTEQVSYKQVSDGVVVEAVGCSAHAATPELGVNALGLLVAELKELPLAQEVREMLVFLSEKMGLETDGTSLGIALQDEVSGNLTLNWGTMDADQEKVTVKINYRYPVTKSYTECAPILDAAFAAAGFVKLEERHKESLYVPEESQLVQTLLNVYQEETHDTARPKSIGGGTYAKAMPNIVAFGPVFPGDEVREHKPDEFIEIDKLMKNALIIANAMFQLAK